MEVLLQQWISWQDKILPTWTGMESPPHHQGGWKAEPVEFILFFSVSGSMAKITLGNCLIFINVQCSGLKKSFLCEKASGVKYWFFRIYSFSPFHCSAWIRMSALTSHLISLIKHSLEQVLHVTWRLLFWFFRGLRVHFSNFKHYNFGRNQSLQVIANVWILQTPCKYSSSFSKK